jgi:hypothetical protein
MLEVSLAARLAEDASARPGAARPWTPAKTGKIAPRLMAAGRTVMGRRRDVAIMRRGSDASTTRNDTPPAAAVERVVWARRDAEARPPDAPVTVPVVTSATQRPWMSWWS